MSKTDLAMLEKAFFAEVEGRRFQSKSKRAALLVERGYLELWVQADPGFYSEWYELTHAGRIAYCQSCEAAS